MDYMHNTVVFHLVNRSTLDNLLYSCILHEVFVVLMSGARRLAPLTMDHESDLFVKKPERA